MILNFYRLQGESVKNKCNDTVLQKLKKDSRGITLVELVCVIGILALLGITVSGILLFATGSYRKGNVETSLQQEVQFTANRINGLIMDATDVVEYGYFEEGNPVAALNEELALEAGAETGTDRYLKIHSARMVYMIQYHAASDKLMYWEINKETLAESQKQLLAEGIAGFEADTTAFAGAKSVQIKLVAEREGKRISSNYMMSARNGSPITLSQDTDEKSASIMVISEAVVEPNQEFFIPITVTGFGIQNSGFRLLPVSEDTLDAETVIQSSTDGIRIKPGRNETGGDDRQIYLVLETIEKDENGLALDTAVVSVRIRRVLSTEVSVAAVSGTPAALPQTAFKSGAKYKFSGESEGQNMGQIISGSYDLDYKNPYYLSWNCYYEKDGVRYDESTAEFSNRFKVVNRVENHGEPYCEIVLLQDMPAGSKLIVSGHSKHAAGTMDGVTYNKSGAEYGEITDASELVSTLSEEVIYITSTIARGADIFFDTTLDVTDLKTRYAPGDGNAQFYWLYRIREKADNGTLGAWTEYRNMQQGGSEKKLNASESCRFLPDRSYQFEIIGAVINRSTNTLYWPCDESLLAAGTGLDGLHKGFGDDEAVTEKEEYGTIHEMPKTSICFMGNASYGIADNSPSYGTEDNHVRVTVGDELHVEFGTPIGIKIDSFKAHMKSVVQKKNGDGWDDVSIQLQQGGVYHLDNLQNYPIGLYRIGVILEDAYFWGDSAGLWDSEYSVISGVDMIMHNFDTDAGTIYFEIY